MSLLVIRFFGELLGYRSSGPAPGMLDHLNAPIHRLPPELVLAITNHLPLESSASLSLTCHSFFSYLGNHCLKRLNDADTQALLCLLEQDLHNHILCPHCNKFHCMSVPRRHHPSERRFELRESQLTCRRADLMSDVGRGILSGFSTTIFRMAMKTYSQGHDTTELLRLLTYQAQTIDKHGFVEYCASAVRIHAGSLLLREQRGFMIPCSQAFPLPWTGGIDICPHIQFATMLGMYMYGIMIPREDKIESYVNKQGIIYCDHCYTEFRVDFKSYGKIGNAMFVTRWMDIGEGQSTKDRKLESRLGGLTEKKWTKVTFRRGSICAGFEQVSEFDFKFDAFVTQEIERKLFTPSRWQWPEGVDILCDNATRYFLVRHGRFLPL